MYTARLRHLRAGDRRPEGRDPGFRLFDDAEDQDRRQRGAAKETGKAVAELAVAKGIKKVVFDRGGYLYHGRVKALADAAREAGLEF